MISQNYFRGFAIEEKFMIAFQTVFIIQTRNKFLSFMMIKVGFHFGAAAKKSSEKSLVHFLNKHLFIPYSGCTSRLPQNQWWWQTHRHTSC